VKAFHFEENIYDLEKLSTVIREQLKEFQFSSQITQDFLSKIFTCNLKCNLFSEVNVLVIELLGTSLKVVPLICCQFEDQNSINENLIHPLLSLAESNPDLNKAFINSEQRSYTTTSSSTSISFYNLASNNSPNTTSFYNDYNEDSFVRGFIEDS
jgi:hypothetical protein